MLCLLFTLIAAVAAEQCQQMCTLEYDPVCGTDGRTYGNPCELVSSACMQRSGVTKLHRGECKPQKVSKMTGCQMACNMNWAPVCGTDGQTYGNECELTTKACLTRSSLAVAFEGECSQCQMMCTRNYDPVCGSDGQTYGNMCELTSQNCLKKKQVRMVRAGECTPAPEKADECQRMCTMDYNPVCGSDGVTYGNMCELTSTACMKKSGVTMTYNGECQENCQMMCTRNYDPVCGSDGQTYGNMCELTSLSCLRRSAVRMAHAGEC